jgi:hypothetical protein
VLSQQLLLRKKRKRLIPLRTETEEAREEYIRGPLGIWPYPILNVLLQFIRRIREATVAPAKPVRRRRTAVYEIIRDERGRLSSIEEHEVEVEE